MFATRSRSDGSRVLHSLLAGVFAGSCAASFCLPPVFAIQSVIQCRALSYIMSARTKAIQAVADALLIRGQSVVFLTVSGPLPLSSTYFHNLVRHINMPNKLPFPSKICTDTSLICVRACVLQIHTDFSTDYILPYAVGLLMSVCICFCVRRRVCAVVR